MIVSQEGPTVSSARHFVLTPRLCFLRPTGDSGFANLCFGDLQLIADLESGLVSLTLKPKPRFFETC
jgi:hypothetical protein